ncbi:hypothetical protein [Vreelandella sp. GE22]
MSDDVSMTICIGDQSACESDTDGTHTHPPDTTSEPPPSEALEGRARHAGNSRPDWRVAASFPDFCQVGNTVVGFDSTASLDSPASYSPNVIMGGQRTYRVGDLSQGTQGNNGAGVVSGTSQGSGHVLFLTGQENVRANGQPVVIDGSEAMINCNAAGVGGAKGYVYTNTQAVDSQPETADEPPTAAASLQQQAQANLERVGELRDALNENPNGKTAAETEALHAEVQQAIADTRVQQEALMEAMREGRLQGDDALATMMDVDEAARQAANMQPEAERQVTYSSEGGRKGREAAVFIAEVATPYGTWVDIKDTAQLLGEGRYLAATGMTALTAVSMIPGVRLLRKGDDVVDAVRTTDRTGSAAQDANRSRPSGSNDGTRVEQNSGRAESSGSSEVTYRGGPHSLTKKPVGDGLDSHHLPADSVSPIPRERGPAIQMDPMDHRATSSHGIQGLSGAEYRAEVGHLIQEGRVRDAMALEIRDVRRAAYEVSGSRVKYNRAVQEMLEYSRNNGLIDIR